MIWKSLYHGLLRLMPIKASLYLIYFRGYRRILNLKTPERFGEKIQWLKLHGNLEALGKYVDKYRVREYVQSRLGKEYLVDLIGIFDSVDEINFEKLPDKFVLKSTNGCKNVLIVNDKESLDIDRIKRLLYKWLSDAYYKEKKEMQYKNVVNRIMIERYLEDETGDLVDYKFYCFDGEPFYYAIASDRKKELKYDYFSANGTLLSDVRTAGIKSGGNISINNELRNEMMEVARKLAFPFQFVRVDLYYVDKQIKFGELTFTDGAGSDAFHPDSFDLEIARNINLITYPDLIDEVNKNY